ncbi:hypothetical protein DFH08DRAFT_802024 [Mycena albidolilacea]|uniref:Alpha-type protein kinase domain-containing protein n=1 Tax=Mycena albidolilacea TaxID=1033008 RepID=A0AAD7EYH3_9AGAR|nr:hypothetical protein DFH08DRAFT_802024 [Mycena albidolilacea]
MWHQNKLGSTLNAFAHYVYLFSQEPTVLADLQTATAVNENDQGIEVLFYMMTHTINGSSGVGDRGKTGIKTFLKKHECGNQLKINNHITRCKKGNRRRRSNSRHIGNHRTEMSNVKFKLGHPAYRTRRGKAPCSGPCSEWKLYAAGIRSKRQGVSTGVSPALYPVQYSDQAEKSRPKEGGLGNVPPSNKYAQELLYRTHYTALRLSDAAK